MKKIIISSSSIDIKHLAKRQWRDYQQKTPGTFFSEGEKEISVEEAYAIQAEFSRLRCSAGDTIIGYKVGCTGPGVVKQFGIAGPIYGRLFKKELHASGKKINHKNFVNLAIEGEMAVIIGEDMKIANIFPVIELHNYIFRAKSKTLTELIANNAINAGVVMSKKSVSKFINNWSNVKTLAVKINGKIIDSGHLWAMKGGATEAVSWLQHSLNQHGFSIKPGNLILTGTPLSLHHVSTGDHISIFADNSELVTCKIE